MLGIRSILPTHNLDVGTFSFKVFSPGIDCLCRLHLHFHIMLKVGMSLPADPSSLPSPPLWSSSRNPEQEYRTGGSWNQLFTPRSLLLPQSKHDEASWLGMVYMLVKLFYKINFCSFFPSHSLSPPIYPLSHGSNWLGNMERAQMSLGYMRSTFVLNF